MKALDLARRGGGRRLGQQMIDPVLPAEAVEQHIDRRLRVLPGEHLAVVGEDLVGNAVGAQRLGEDGADSPGDRSGHQAGRHAEPGVVVEDLYRPERGRIGQPWWAPSICHSSLLAERSNRCTTSSPGWTGWRRGVPLSPRRASTWAVS